MNRAESWRKYCRPPGRRPRRSLHGWILSGGGTEDDRREGGREEKMTASFFKKMIPCAMLPLFFILAAPMSSAAQEGPSKERTVKVQGQGKVRAVPDQVEMEFEVQEEGTQLADVSARVAEKMKALFQAVKSFGILDKDFK